MFKSLCVNFFPRILTINIIPRLHTCSAREHPALEKKLNQNQAAVLLLLDFFITGAYDQFAVLIPAKSMPEELVRIGEYAHSITLHLPINELFGGIWLVSLVKAMMELNTLRIANYNEQLRRQEAAALRVPVEVDEPTDMM